MLDTNICSYIIKNRPVQVLKKFKSVGSDSLCISSVTLAELSYWVSRNKRLHKASGNPGTPNINEEIINDFTNHLEILDFSPGAARVYGIIRDTLSASGINVGNMDLLIASHALTQNLCLVTNNTKDFRKIPGIILENWV